MIAMKYYDFEIETPTLRDILKHFKVGKMNFNIKESSLSTEKILEFQQVVFETVYEYIWERQMDLLSRINWQIPIITVKHFIDHYKRILPVFDKKGEDGIAEIWKFKDFFKLDESAQTALSSNSTEGMIKKCRNDILEWIDAISKLAPLSSEYIDFKTKELATASLVLAIKYWIKGLVGNPENKKLDYLRSLYSTWVKSLFSTHNISKEVVQPLIKKLQVFLDRVCQ